MRQNLYLFKLTLLLVQAALLTEAFAPVVRPTSPSSMASQVLTSTSLDAKKRRRRKDRAPSAEETESVVTSNNELPDFDLKEEQEEEEQTRRKSTKAIITDPDTITPAMMGSNDGPVRSVKDLISDRSLESNFEFDDQSDENLPDLVELMRNQGNTVSSTPTQEAVPGSKKARQAERRAAAMAREAQEQEDNASPLDALNGIPFLVDEEKGKVTYLKVVEAGTWLSIFILVGWEIYINSPFFDRAAPISPVVF